MSNATPIPTDARCRACDYPLRALPAFRCSKCGRVFDPGRPATMRLPVVRSCRVRRWLVRPIARWLRPVPVVATSLILWGARLPGWNNPWTYAGVVLWVTLLVGYGPAFVVRRAIARRGGRWRRVAAIDRRFNRRAAAAFLVSVGLLVVPVPLYVLFALSRPAFDRAATAVLARPFLEKPDSPGWVGFYYVDAVDRCPHGLEFDLVTFPMDDSDEPGRHVGFIYKNWPGSCVRHAEPDRALGGFWYTAAVQGNPVQYRIGSVLGGILTRLMPTLNR